jgi:hypothetical protein
MVADVREQRCTGCCMHRRPRLSPPCPRDTSPLHALSSPRIVTRRCLRGLGSPQGPIPPEAPLHHWHSPPPCGGPQWPCRPRSHCRHPWDHMLSPRRPSRAPATARRTTAMRGCRCGRRASAGACCAVCAGRRGPHPGPGWARARASPAPPHPPQALAVARAHHACAVGRVRVSLRTAPRPGRRSVAVAAPWTLGCCCRSSAACQEGRGEGVPQDTLPDASPFFAR